MALPRRRPRCMGPQAPFGPRPVLLLLLLLLLLALWGQAAAARGGASGGRRRSPLELSCRRLLQEFKDVMASGMTLGVTAATSSLSNSTEHVRLAPCRGNLHEWHFTIAGPPDSVYEGGLYHGRVLLPVDYPASAPRLQMLNPSGRFEVGADICLSATSFHQETWQPVWTVRTLVSALRSHMATKAVEVGGIEASAARRLVLAHRSRAFRCRHCGTDHARFVEGEGEGVGGLFRDLPTVDLPEHVLKRQAQMAKGGSSGGSKGVVGGSGLPPLLLAVYRLRVPLVLGLGFLFLFILLNAPSSSRSSGPIAFL